MLTNILRQAIAQKKEPFLFQPYRQQVDFTAIPDSVGLYIHIPFCQSLCPYCPYNKTLYDKDLAGQYKNSLLRELGLLQEHLSKKLITSIYIGGGTPTLMLPELAEVLAWIRTHLTFSGDVGIEVYPTGLDQEKFVLLQEMGVNLISLGVQTFNDEHLRFLGRRYRGSEARAAVELVKKAGFDCVDVDIMFNLPNQAVSLMAEDIRTCYSEGIEQLSIYPLIIFPMTNLQQKIKGDRMHTFNSLQEYGLLKRIEEISTEWGYEKTSVWTYGKKGSKRYTSVTRESFVGIGAGASSLFGSYFYLNTFEVEEYIRRLGEGHLPINLVNTMSEREKMVFWLFWRCYETAIDTKRFAELFGRDLRKEFPLLTKFLQCSGLARQNGRMLELTRMGTYLYHLVEKQYSLTYLNDMWDACMKTPWPEKIAL